MNQMLRIMKTLELGASSLVITGISLEMRLLPRALVTRRLKLSKHNTIDRILN